MVTNNITPAMADYIIRKVEENNVFFIHPEQVKEDIANNRLYVLEDNGTPIAMCAIIYDTLYNYYAIKRLLIFDEENRGKHYADMLIKHCTTLGLSPLGCTPWTHNKKMHHLLEKNGFSLQYIFDGKWCFYLCKLPIDKSPQV